MTRKSKKSDELHLLLNQIVDGEDGGEACKRLDELLSDDPEACEIYLDYMTLHANLQYEFGGERPEMPGLFRESQESGGGSMGTGSNIGFKGRHFNPRNMAAVLLLVTGLVLGMILDKDDSAKSSSSRPYVAMIKSALDAEWDGDCSTSAVGGKIKQGDFVVHSGLIELELFDGAVIVLEGPSRLKLLSTNRVALDYGIMGAFAGPEAVGFEVETPAAKLIDRGTRFGVRVSEDGVTEMEVFSGKVDISSGGDGGKEYSINELSAVRINPGDEKYANVPAGTIRFPQPGREISYLVNGGFENNSKVEIEDIPTKAGRWFGDPCLIVGPDEGVAPMSGTSMLKFVATNPPTEGPDLGTAASQRCQVVDMRSMSEDILAGRVSVHASAYFNRVEGDEATDVLMAIEIHALRGNPDEAAQLRAQLHAFRLGRSGTEILTDGDPLSWQRCEAMLLLPQGTDYVMVEVRAVENVFNDPLFKEFDGHYADDVGLDVRIGATPSGV